MGQDLSLLWSPFSSTEPSAVPQAKRSPTTSRISGDSTYRARKCSCKSLKNFLIAQTHSCIPFVHQAREVSELDLRALSLNAETLQLAAKNDCNVIDEIGRCLWEIFLSAERLASPEIDKLIRDNHFRCNLILLGIDEAHLLVPCSIIASTTQLTIDGLHAQWCRRWHRQCTSCSLVEQTCRSLKIRFCLHSSIAAQEFHQ